MVSQAVSSTAHGVASDAMLQLGCGKCGTVLSHRAMCVQLVSEPNTVLFSTDVRPEGVRNVSGNFSLPEQCACQVQQFACACGHSVGYHLVEPCFNCRNMQEKDGHWWFLRPSCVGSEPVRDTMGKLVHWPLAHRFSEQGAISRELSLGSCGLEVPAFPLLDGDKEVSLGQQDGGISSVVPLCELSGRSRVPVMNAPSLTCHLKEQHVREAELRQLQGALIVRADELIARDTKVFSPDFQDRAREKILRGFSVAQTEAEGQLRKREEQVVTRERRHVEALERQQLAVKEATEKAIASAVELATLSDALRETEADLRIAREESNMEAARKCEQISKLQEALKAKEANSLQERARANTTLSHLGGRQEELDSEQQTASAALVTGPMPHLTCDNVHSVEPVVQLNGSCLDAADPMPRSVSQVRHTSVTSSARPRAEPQDVAFSYTQFHAEQRVDEKRRTLCQWDESLTLRERAGEYRTCSHNDFAPLVRAQNTNPVCGMVALRSGRNAPKFGSTPALRGETDCSGVPPHRWPGGMLGCARRIRYGSAKPPTYSCPTGLGAMLWATSR